MVDVKIPHDPLCPVVRYFARLGVLRVMQDV